MPTSPTDRPRRAAAVAGALLAAGTAAGMALAVGTAAADVPGRCATNVNVRAEPDITSTIVNRCQAGTAVQVGEERNGFVWLPALRGWAAKDYVAVDGAAATPASAPTAVEPVPTAPADADVPADVPADGTTVTPPQQEVVVDGVERTPTDSDDARGIATRSAGTAADG
jgi:hypothetical protein